MFEDKAMVQACLLKVSSGATEDLADYQVEVLQTAGLIEPVGTVKSESKYGPRFLEYQLTRAGRETLWPPEKK